MSTTHIQITSIRIVEEEVQLTLAELCQACNAPQASVIAWVNEGILEPSGEAPDNWHFTGTSLRRARKATWLTRDMEVNAQGVGLVLDLLDEIAELRTRLDRAGLA